MGLLEIVLLLLVLVTLVLCLRTMGGSRFQRVLAWAASWTFVLLLVVGVRSLQDEVAGNDVTGIFLIVLAALFLFLASRMVRGRSGVS